MDSGSSYFEYLSERHPWLGEMPTDWEPLRAKHLFRELNERSEAGEEQHLSMSQVLGLVPANLVEKSLASESYEGAKLVADGDLVLNRLKAHLAVFSVAPMVGVVSPDYSVFRLRHGSDNPKYFEHLFKTPVYLGELRRRVKGIVEGFYRLYSDDFLTLPVYRPPPTEQDRIVTFLDERTAEIDEAIGKKRRLIELLNEQKAILINRAVTRGLDPSVPMKDSGVDWIGEIPAHWEVKPLRRLSKIHAGNGFPVELQGDSAGTVPFFKVSDFSAHTKVIETANNLVSERTVAREKWNKVPAGSLVTAKIGEALRRNHRNLIGVDGIIDNNCIAFEPSNVDVGFFFHLHRLIDFDWFVNPGTVPSISVPKYKAAKVALPPKAEQRDISAACEEVVAATASAVAAEQRTIDALSEFKQTLIANAVTGKIKI